MAISFKEFIEQIENARLRVEPCRHCADYLESPKQEYYQCLSRPPKWLKEPANLMMALQALGRRKATQDLKSLLTTSYGEPRLPEAEFLNLLKQQSSAFIKDAGESLLLVSCMVGQIEIVRYLLDQGVSPNTENPQKVSALSHAFHVNNQAILNLLLERGADPNHVNVWGTNILYSATNQRDGEEFVLRFLEMGVSPLPCFMKNLKGRDSKDRFPLYEATRCGQSLEAVVNRCIEYGGGLGCINPRINESYRYSYGLGMFGFTREAIQNAEILIIGRVNDEYNTEVLYTTVDDFKREVFRGEISFKLNHIANSVLNADRTLLAPGVYEFMESLVKQNAYNLTLVFAQGRRQNKIPQLGLDPLMPMIMKMLWGYHDFMGNKKTIADIFKQATNQADHFCSDMGRLERKAYSALRRQILGHEPFQKGWLPLSRPQHESNAASFSSARAAETHYDSRPQTEDEMKQNHETRELRMVLRNNATRDTQGNKPKFKK